MAGGRVNAPIRVVVVDDHPVFRLGLIALFEDVEDVDVVGEAVTASEAVEVIAAAAPDVVLLDLHLPDRSGIEITRELSERHVDVAVLVLTMVEDGDTLFAAMRAGARGYVVKGAGQDELVRAIRAVRAGDILIGAAVAGHTSEVFSARPAAPFPGLTERENEILDLMGRGLDNAAIGRRLVVSPKTVANHVSNILMKIRASSRAEAVARARDAGLGRN